MAVPVSLLLAAWSLLLLALSSAAAVEVKRPQGVSLSNRHFYDEYKPFTCLDGSKTIPFDEVNDDYCDCKDGSDEPGTSACPNGSFHCTNAGHRPQYIPSSRVNDGICDCCDTTDEYNSGSSCENTCKEQGRKEKETLQKMAEIAKEGLLLKQQLIEEAKRSRQDKQQALTDLQKKKETWETNVESLKAAKEELEKPELEAKEIHKKAWDEVQAARKLEKEKAKAAETFKELDDDEDGFVSISEIQTHPELDSDGDGVVSEQEAESVLGGVRQVDVSSFRDAIWAGIQDKYKSEAAVEIPTLPEIPAEEGEDSHSTPHREEWKKDDRDEDDDDGGGEEHDDDGDEDEEEEEEGGEEHYKPNSYLPEKQDTGEEKMPAYDDETQALIDAAENARNEFSEAEKSLKEVESLIGYVYRLCPFNKVVQKPKHGGSETSLGLWGSWAGSENNRFSAMKYEHGTGCWQGPSRSTLVKLSCGKESAVLSTSEPSRCEYLMEFSTPAFCQEESDEEGADHDEL
ncbi:glucosidase 2 subunit beta [Scyliorhinus canicula]|uniref:glucosidase 2 subunit beta n=1 Tax=Scyliorhinus canicula TaxID=7830 RepID=UPI0018F3BA26|nr:glucosidase 2 subunit beta [Scyliorhinus canicula]